MRIIAEQKNVGVLKDRSMLYSKYSNKQHCSRNLALNLPSLVAKAPLVQVNSYSRMERGRTRKQGNKQQDPAWCRITTCSVQQVTCQSTFFAACFILSKHGVEQNKCFTCNWMSAFRLLSKLSSMLDFRKAGPLLANGLLSPILLQHAKLLAQWKSQFSTMWLTGAPLKSLPTHTWLLGKALSHYDPIYSLC